MTIFDGYVVALLSFVLATSPWIIEAGNDGLALQLFLNKTSNGTFFGSTFEPDKLCSMNFSTLLQSDDKESVVIFLNFSGQSLSGSIPNGSIGNLSSLQQLDLSMNKLSGSVPEDFVKLLNLTHLNLSRNLMIGKFPAFVQNLSALQHLDFSANSITGDIPELSKITNLSVVRLERNFLRKLPDKFPPRLTDLDLTWNNLIGSIPPAIFDLTSLVSLRLANNLLYGAVSASALTATATKLQTLDLSNNSLTGSIPELNYKLSLVTLDLHQNNFTGKIPGSSLPVNLSVLDLHDNLLGGNLTELVDFLKNSDLTILDLSSNNFNLQDFPSNFSNFNHLTTLGLAGNQFTSHRFPPLLTSVIKLQILNLSNTNLSGTIPDSIGNMSSLVRLDLSQNNLDGSIPWAVGALTGLESLNLSRNNLDGSIPSSLSRSTFLSTFDVSSNNLSGSIPESTQFSTFNVSWFRGNPGLCGSPLAKCDNRTTETSTSKKKSSSGAIIAGLVTGIVVILIVVAALFIWCRVSRAVKPLVKDGETKHVSGPMQYEKDAESWATGIKDSGSIAVVMFEKPLLNLTFADLLQATANFSKELQIADGGYGPVYKGVLPDTTQLAIKVLVEVGFADETKAAARIEALAKVKHANLVPLIGYCLVGEDSVLIYEYMVNGDLQRWLHELPEGTRNPEDWSGDTWEHPEGVEMSGEYLSWPTRHKIALGTARGLAFLHHGCSPHIIHRDVKSSNILLDETFDAHLVDSGLAGIARTSGTPIIGGTLGYVPPEYGQTWQATTRGDVYSFGVVLLELVTGRAPTGNFFHDSYGGNLVGWVRSMIRLDKRGQKALDPKLVSRGFVPEMLETLRIGYLCTAETPAKRPTMQQVVGLLKDCQYGAMS